MFILLHLTFKIYLEMQKAPTSCFRKTPALGGTDDLVLGAVPFLKGRQKRPNCFSQKGRTAGRWIWFVRASGAGALFQLAGDQKGHRSVGCGQPTKRTLYFRLSFYGNGSAFFVGPYPIQKGHRLKTAQNGEIVGFKSCQLLSNLLLHLSFDQLIFDP